MTCKHRWEPSFEKVKRPSTYIYQCTRCFGIIFTKLKTQ